MISVIGAKAYDVLSDLCSPVAPSEKTYTQPVTILKNHFARKKQSEGKSVSVFTTNLKHLALTCEFSTHLNKAFWGRFVCDLRSQETLVQHP